MLKHKPSLFVLLASLIVTIIFIGLSFMLEGFVVLFFVLAVLMLVSGVFSFQILYAMHIFKQDQIETLKHSRPCPYCEKLIYKTDEVCPYCKQVLKDE